jgi:hypothetical protein
MNLGKISAKHSGVDLTEADRASGVKSESAYPCPCGQRILRTLETASPSLTKRYQPVFTGLAVVKVSSGLA